MGGLFFSGPPLVILAPDHVLKLRGAPLALGNGLGLGAFGCDPFDGNVFGDFVAVAGGFVVVADCPLVVFGHLEH
ncbi:Uncharacterised protein [Mycobacteroides abscessus subsp. massiliense]|nr:Uncharacterised protein [Mycobacteroides abscessus subsp. massiliense]